MPRKPRMFIAGVPCHVIQRGNNRSVCFFESENYQFYLECLATACQKYRVDLHAYVLMTNHIHLLMTPKDDIGISQVMQSVGRNYVQYINGYLNRTGTLFEGRFKASLVQQDGYFLACMRYIELNPVRAQMVSSPLDYPWSSYHVNAGYKERKLLAAHECYSALVNRGESRLYQNYRQMVAESMAENIEQTITTSIKFNMPTGDNRFSREIEIALGRKIGFACRGRPKIKLTS